MALESILNRTYTHQSDVWSYGKYYFIVYYFIVYFIANVQLAVAILLENQLSISQ